MNRLSPLFLNAVLVSSLLIVTPACSNTTSADGGGGDGGSTSASEGGGGSTSVGGAGGTTMTTAELPDLPTTWSDDETKCKQFAGIGPKIPDENDAWTLSCVPVSEAGLVHHVRVYPIVGGQCAPLATDMLVFSAPPNMPPTETPSNALLINLPVPEIPAGQMYQKEDVLFDTPFMATPGMFCIALRLAVDTTTDTSTCFVNATDNKPECGTSWLSKTIDPFAWNKQPQAPVFGVNNVIQ